LNGFVPWAVPIALGAVGAAIGWVVLEFVGKPCRVFLDVKKECVELLVLFGNVGPIGIELRDDPLRPRDPGIIGKEERLRSAQEAFRKCGSKLQTFAKTETLAVFALRAIGFRPLEAGRGFIGLSNSISEYGETRYQNRLLVERSLKAGD